MPLRAKAGSVIKGGEKSLGSLFPKNTMRGDSRFEEIVACLTPQKR
jgi:hypothetical protein